MINKQVQAWASKFGVDYTNRNDMTTFEMDDMYTIRYGISRSEMNQEFLDDLDRNIAILEVGSNIGLQLKFLQFMGFKNLYGIEISDYAVEIAKQRTKGINIIKGNALDISFKDSCFDLVFTSGVLIHINPNELKNAMREIYRVSNHYIWGFEYYAEKLTQIKYRDAEQTSDLLWKDNFPKLYCDSFKDLKIVKRKMYSLLHEDNVDVMFLLSKGN